MGDIKIYVPQKKFIIKERIHFSNGTTLANDNRYEINSYIPNLPWRSLSEDEILEMTNIDNIKEPYKEVVTVFKFPSYLRDIFRKLEFYDATNNVDARNKIIKYENLIPEFDQSLNTFLGELDSGKKRHMLGIFVLPPNQPSVATRKETSRYLGLHFDDAKGLNIRELTNKSNRISFNLGQKKRYIWIIDKSLNKIIEELEKSKVDYLNLKDVAEKYLKLNPNYPVTRISIHPNEAYIAPTDYILHDGSTEGIDTHDITFVVLGYFNPLNVFKYD